MTTIDEALKAAEELGAQVLDRPEDLLEGKRSPNPGVLARREGVSVSSLLPSKSPLSESDIKSRIEMQKNLMQLDTQVQSCIAIDRHWLEYDPKVIAHLCGGDLPEAGYMIYKNIRLVVPGSLPDIIKREKVNIDDYVYVQDGELFVGKL